MAKYVPYELRKIIYHTLFESHLTYGIRVRGGVFIIKFNKAFNAQNIASVVCFVTQKLVLKNSELLPDVDQQMNT